MNKLTPLKPGDKCVTWTVVINHKNDIQQMYASQEPFEYRSTNMVDIKPVVARSADSFYVSLTVNVHEVELMTEQMHTLLIEEIKLRQKELVAEYAKLSKFL